MTTPETPSIQIGNLALIVVVAAVFIFDPPLAIRISFTIATIWLSLLLIAPRLLKSARFARWHKQLLIIARNSKWTGVWTALWFLGYAALALLARLPLNGVQLWTGSLVLTIFLTLLALSNSWSYQHIKWWKHLNMLIWMLPPLLMTYILFAPAGSYLPIWAAYTLLPLATLVGLLSIFAKPRDYFAPLRLRLIGVAAFSCIIVIIIE